VPPAKLRPSAARGAPRPAPALQRLAPGIFYGWFVALGTAGVSLAVVSVGFYGLMIFLGELCEVRGWDRAAVSGATSFYWITAGLAGTAIGRAVDRFGARRFIVGGAALMAAALLLLARVEEPWQLYPVYGLLAVGFACAGNVPNGSLVTRWFVERRSLAMSISHTGVSLGGMLLVPGVTLLIARAGFGPALGVLAAFLVVAVWSVAGGVLRPDPALYGWGPDGRDPGAREPAAGTPAQLSDAVQRRVWGRREVLRTPTFWLLVASFSAMLFCQVGFTMHHLAFLRERLAPETAALGVSAMAGASLVARLGMGFVADRFSKQRLAAVLFVLQAASFGLFAAAEGPVGLMAASVLLGATIGNIFMMQSLLVGELFGLASFGTAMGLQLLGTQVTSGLGPLAVGLLHGWNGGYEPALGGLAAVALAAAALVLRLRPPAPPAPQPAGGPSTTAS